MNRATTKKKRPLNNKQLAVGLQRASVVQQLRRFGPQSRAELSRGLNLSASTTGAHVDSLIDGGFLRERAPETVGLGRPAVALELSPRAGQFIGVDIEARQIEALSVDFSQQPLKTHRQRVDRSAPARKYVQEIEVAIAAVADCRPILGIGLAVPGIVAPDRGVAVHHSLIRDWNDLPLGKHISEKFKARVWLENNVRAMAVAERWSGQGRDCDHFVCLGVRSGIAAGVIMDGELYRGPGNLAGEIGHWRISPSQSRTLADVASIKAVLKRLTQMAETSSTKSTQRQCRIVSVDEVLRRAKAVDPPTLKVLNKAATSLGFAASQLNLLLNPERIIVAGPLAALGEILLSPIRECVQRGAPPLLASVPDIVASNLGDQIGAIGASCVAVRHWQPTEA